MPVFRVRQARHDTTKARVRQPLRNAASQDALAEMAFTRDHQDSTCAVRLGRQEKLHQPHPRLVLVQPVQVQPRGQGFAAACDAVTPVRLDALGYDRQWP